MAEKKIQNPLEELFTDSSQIGQEALSTILKPYLRLHRETGTVIFTPNGLGISANKRIILLFLAKKALYMLGVLSSECLAPKDIKFEFGKSIPHGTIDASLKRLLANGPLKVQNKKYFIPDFNFYQVQAMFNQLNNR